MKKNKQSREHEGFSLSGGSCPKANSSLGRYFTLNLAVSQGHKTRDMGGRGQEKESTLNTRKDIP